MTWPRTPDTVADLPPTPEDHDDHVVTHRRAGSLRIRPPSLDEHVVSSLSRSSWRQPACLLAAGSADAAHTGGLVYPPACLEPVLDVSNNGDGVTGDSVACPKSHPHPTGGGVLIEGSDPKLDLEVHTTSPTLFNDGWKVQANNSSGADAQMTIYAICATGDFVYRSVTLSVAAGHVKGAKVTCPAGTKVVGGGVVDGRRRPQRRGRLVRAG